MCFFLSIPHVCPHNAPLLAPTFNQMKNHSNWLALPRGLLANTNKILTPITLHMQRVQASFCNPVIHKLLHLMQLGLWAPRAQIFSGPCNVGKRIKIQKTGGASRAQITNLLISQIPVSMPHYIVHLGQSPNTSKNMHGFQIVSIVSSLRTQKTPLSQPSHICRLPFNMIMGALHM
jgi:hypothetical protein